jgi:plastocyanin
MRYALTCCVALAAIAAVPVASGSRSTAEPEIEMEDFSFRPARLMVRPGAVVIWKNRDRAPHNAASVARSAGKRLFRTRTTGFRGEVTARAPGRVGTFAYICTVHPRMRGTLVVRR